MVDPLQHIMSILTLPSVDVPSVSKAFGVQLTKASKNPHWIFYESAASEQFEKVSLNLSKDGSRWLLGWNYQPELAPFERDLDLK